MISHCCYTNSRPGRNWCVFMEWHSVKHRDNFIYIFTLPSNMD